jgi:hypothetical protein
MGGFIGDGSDEARYQNLQYSQSQAALNVTLTTTINGYDLGPEHPSESTTRVRTTHRCTPFQSAIGVQPVTARISLRQGDEEFQNRQITVSAGARSAERSSPKLKHGY